MPEENMKSSWTEKKTYKVYEITPDCRKHGRLLKSYRSIDRANNFMAKSIYRYMKEERVLEGVICLVNGI